MALSPPTTGKRIRSRHVGAATAVTCALVAAIAGIGASSAGASLRTPPPGAVANVTRTTLNPSPPTAPTGLAGHVYVPPTTAPSGYAAAVPQTPPAPQALVNGRLRPLSAKEVADLKGTGKPVGSYDCEITFDDDDAIDLLPDDALNTFVMSPWWNQHCGDNWVRVYPSHIDHFHLTFADPNVTNCLNSDNEYDTPYGAIARGEQECEPIDPVTEPRGFAHSMVPTDVLNIERLKGQDYELSPFTLQRIKAVTNPIRLCFQIQTTTPWVAGLPPGPDDHPGQYCWSSLGVGTWDMSEYVKNAIRVTVKVADPGIPNFGIDNIRFDW
jgi:hypothetical protein